MQTVATRLARIVRKQPKTTRLFAKARRKPRATLSASANLAQAAQAAPSVLPIQPGPSVPSGPSEAPTRLAAAMRPAKSHMAPSAPAGPPTPEPSPAAPAQRTLLTRLRAPFDAAIVAPGLIIVALGMALIGRAVGAPTLDAVAPLVGAVSLGATLRRAEARRAIHLHLLSAAVVAYALLSGLAALLTLRAAPPVALLERLVAGMGPAVTPIAFYFVGAALCAPVGSSSSLTRALVSSTPTIHNGEPATPAPQNMRLESAITRLACALLGVALPLAGWAAAQAVGALRTGETPGAPASVGLPDPATLANLLALAVVVASASDAPNATLRFLLGEAPHALTANRRARTLVVRAYRALLAVCVPLGALLLVAGIALTWSRMALLATGAALLVVSVARRRYGRLVVFALALIVVLALLPRGFSGWFDASFVAFGANLSPTQAPAFMATLASLTVIGLAMARLWVAYGRLRPTSGAAGVTLATLGAMVYALVASMTSAPLSEPAVGVICWLLLGMASGVADALEQSAGHADQRDSAHHADQLVDGATLTARAALGDAARERPLRTLFVVDATASDETRAALTETIRAFDRRRVIPQLITLASPTTLVATNATTQGKHASRGAVTGALRHWVGAWRRWAELLRVILDARPDLIVAASPRAYLPTVFAGRLVGAPVQWHAREVAAPGLQRALDTFAPWASGIVACSQYVARSFQIEALGSRVRVVRLGVAAPTPAAEERHRELRAALRASLGTADADPLIIYPGPIATGSGHADLIQAMRVLRARHPHAMLLLASETGVGGRRTTPSAAQSPNADLYNLVCADPRQGQRLACAISLNRLDGAIQALGLRADLAAVIAACDLAVFPQWAAPVSRGLTLTLSQGVPIVAVQAGALPEQLADAWGCLLAPPRDPAALADALSQAITRLGALREDARHNRSLVRDWQSAGIEAARLQTLYRQLCLPKTRKRTRSASQPATPPPPKTATPVPLTARSHAWAATLWSMGRE